MPNGLFEVETFPTVLALANELAADDEAGLGRIVTLVRLNPWPDGVLKFSFRMGSDPAPALDELVVYNDGEWTIIYRIVRRRIQVLDAWKSRT